MHLRVPQKEVGKRASITFFVFGTLSVTFWSLFLMLLSHFSSRFCQTPFASLLLRQGEHHPQFCTFGVHPRFCGGGAWISQSDLSWLIPPEFANLAVFGLVCQNSS